MTAYYNENDSRAAAWLRELIKAGMIAAGDVDERSICDVQGRGLPRCERCDQRLAWQAGHWGEQRDLRMGDAALPPCERLGQLQHVAGGQAGPWSDFYLVACRDGKARRVKSGLRVLAHGVPGRVGLLRGYGNAIVPQVQAAFILEFSGPIGETHDRNGI